MAKKIIKIVLLALLSAALIYSIVIEIKFAISLSKSFSFSDKIMRTECLHIIALLCSLCLVIVNIVVILKHGGIKERIAYSFQDYQKERARKRQEKEDKKIKKLREKLEKLER